MQLKIVYRAEIREDPSRSVYNYVQYKCVKHWSELPTPNADIHPDISLKDMNCGTRTLQQFFLWWKQEDLPAISEMVALHILEVPTEHVIEGEYQCIFNRSKARVIGHIDPVTSKGVYYA